MSEATPDDWPPHPEREPQWPASLALLVGFLLLVLNPRRLDFGPTRWIIPGLEAALAIALMISWPDRLKRRERHSLRRLSIALIALLTFANVVDLVLLLRLLVEGAHVDGGELARAAVAIWSTNVIAFACWYWELDGGGPYRRRDESRPTRDFLFPQMTDDARPYAPRGWYPSFVDYLYVSFTNATAFSPTDTMPLTRWSKTLMAVQSLASLATLAVLAARAINILS